jgi:hypothetical protein
MNKKFKNSNHITFTSKRIFRKINVIFITNVSANKRLEKYLYYE